MKLLKDVRMLNEASPESGWTVATNDGMDETIKGCRDVK
jgi:hypothetical protein